MVTVNVGHGGPTRLSDSGSRMGAARLGQVASDAVIVSLRRPLTCAKAVTWPVWPVEHCVRIEGVRGSNPLSSTQTLRSALWRAVMLSCTGAFCPILGAAVSDFGSRS
jgi:hypothetical protein